MIPPTSLQTYAITGLDEMTLHLQRPCLDGISSELRIEITSYLANTDTKSVRLMCKAYYEAATQHLFRSVLVCPRERALVALYHISSLPNLASCVKELVFDGSLYSDTIASSKDNYYRAENEWANGPRSGHAHPSDPDYSRQVS